MAGYLEQRREAVEDYVTEKTGIGGENDPVKKALQDAGSAATKAANKAKKAAAKAKPQVGSNIRNIAKPPTAAEIKKAAEKKADQAKAAANIKMLTDLQKNTKIRTDIAPVDWAAIKNAPKMSSLDILNRAKGGSPAATSLIDLKGLSGTPNVGDTNLPGLNDIFSGISGGGDAGLGTVFGDVAEHGVGTGTGGVIGQFTGGDRPTTGPNAQNFGEVGYGPGAEGGGNPVIDASGRSDGSKDTGAVNPFADTAAAPVVKAVTDPIVEAAEKAGVGSGVSEPASSYDPSSGKAPALDPYVGPFLSGTNQLDPKFRLFDPAKPNQYSIEDQLSRTGLDALEARATQKGASPWLKMAQEKQGLEETGLINSAAAQQAGAEAGARANLAMRGGLRGGAAERLATAGGNNLALARQGVRQQGALERSGLGLADEGFKMDFLKQLPGAQLSAANYQTARDQQNIQNILQPKQFDINTSMDELGKANQFGSQRFQTEMQGYGAAKTADAIAKSGKK